MPAVNQTHTGTWTVNDYALTFDSAGGTTVTTLTGAFGSVVTPPTPPTRIGYTFA